MRFGRRLRRCRNDAHRACRLALGADIRDGAESCPQALPSSAIRRVARRAFNRCPSDRFVAMEKHLSTDAVRPSERIAYWSDAVCSAFVRLDLECDARLPFRSELEIRETAKFDFIAVSGSAQRVRRSARHVSDDPAESLIVMLQRQGDCIATQDGREIRLPPGSLAFLDSRRPYDLHFPAPFRQTVVKVPARMLEHRLGALSTYTSRPVAAGCRPGRLACMAIAELGREKRDNLALPLADIAFDLFGLALAEVVRRAPGAATMAGMRVQWAKAQIRSGLRDPALSPAAVAAQQGVSLRLLQRLFAAEGSSLAGYIAEQRLLRCRDALRDPSQAGRSITDIALSWGYSDASHFSTSFRRRFGHPPSELRRTA
jgi:AraC-like DNA-binding protein